MGTSLRIIYGIEAVVCIILGIYLMIPFQQAFVFGLLFLMAGIFLGYGVVTYPPKN